MKKEVFNIIKNGRKFKLIIRHDSNGNIFSAMERPNLKIIDPRILASGAHVFADPLFNHVDFFQSGALVSKEYPEIKGSTNYGYTLSGSALII